MDTIYIKIVDLLSLLFQKSSDWITLEEFELNQIRKFTTSCNGETKTIILSIVLTFKHVQIDTKG